MAQTDTITLKQIAAVAGVSVDTVSRALFHKNKEGRPSSIRRGKQVRQIARELGYQPSGVARAMRSGRTGQIGILVRNAPDRPLHHLEAYEMILGINEAFCEREMVAVLIPLNEMSKEEHHQSRMFRERLLDGIVVVGNVPSWAEDLVEDRMPNSIWLDSNIRNHHGCIHQAERQAGSLVAKHASKAGYRRIFCLGFPEHEHLHYSVTERRAGIEAVVREETLSIDHMLREENLMMGDPRFSTEALRPLLERMCRRDTAVVAYTAHWAQNLMNRAAMLGWLPGRDFGLASCDSNATIENTWPDLSRIRVDHYRMGKRAGEMMSNLLNNKTPPCSEVFSGQWVAGCTVGGKVS